jgi:hypothetical protein
MVSEFNEHEHIGIRGRNSFFDSGIIDIVLMDICKEDFKISCSLFLSERFLDIEMIELLTIPKEYSTEYQERYTSKITASGKTISRFHLLPEIDERYDDEKSADRNDIG